jgi:sugar-specific transcriptional regulator TrmB
MSELLEKMQDFGFIQYEARCYVALVQIGKSTAYQISKISGVPRARIYDTLEGLVKRGIVMMEEDQEGNKNYSPLPVDVLLDQIKDRLERSLDEVKKELKGLEKCQPSQEIYVATVRGKENVLAFCRILLRRAKRQVIISMWEPMYNELLTELTQLVSRNCHLKGIVFGVEHPIGELCSHRVNPYMTSITDQTWFILSVDGTELIYGDSAERDGNAFYTDDPVHLFLLEDYVWHDVLVNRLVQKGSQEQLDKWILPEMERFFGKKMVPTPSTIADKQF